MLYRTIEGRGRPGVGPSPAKAGVGKQGGHEVRSYRKAEYDQV